jgi:hypothetical protein
MKKQIGKWRENRNVVHVIGSIILMLILFIPNSLTVYYSESPRKVFLRFFLGAICIVVGLFMGYIAYTSDKRNMREYEERKNALIEFIYYRDKFIVSHMLASLVMTSDNPEKVAEELWRAYKAANTAWENGETTITISDTEITFERSTLPEHTTDPRNN